VHGLLPSHFPAAAESIYDTNHAERMKEQDGNYFRDAFAGSVSPPCVHVRLANVAVRAADGARPSELQNKWVDFLKFPNVDLP
jgi:hypothetical protein